MSLSSNGLADVSVSIPGKGSATLGTVEPRTVLLLENAGTAPLLVTVTRDGYDGDSDSVGAPAGMLLAIYGPCAVAVEAGSSRGRADLHVADAASWRAITQEVR